MAAMLALESGHATEGPVETTARFRYDSKEFFVLRSGFFLGYHLPAGIVMRIGALVSEDLPDDREV